MNFINLFKKLNPKSFNLRLIILFTIIIGLHFMLSIFNNKCGIEHMTLPTSEREKQRKLNQQLLDDINNAKKRQKRLTEKLKR